MCGSSGIVCLLNKSVDSTVRVDNAFLEYNLKDPFKGTHQNFGSKKPMTTGRIIYTLRDQSFTSRPSDSNKNIDIHPFSSEK